MELQPSCACLFARSLILTRASLQEKSRATASAARRALLRACARGLLLRVSRGSYIWNYLSDPARVPTSIFPWWGSKRRHVRVLVSILRAEQLRAGDCAVTSLFAGTGVVEATLRNMKAKVVAYDLDARVVNMHRALSTAARRAEVARVFRSEVKAMRRRARSARAVRHRKRLREEVLSATTAWGDPVLAARWNLGLRCSYLGLLSGAFVSERLDSLRVERVCRALVEHRGLGPACRFKDAFAALRATPAQHLLFIDPPYLLEAAERQYSAGDFGPREHARLARELRGRHFVLCHREDRAIRKLYGGWCQILRLARIMSINRVSKSGLELVIIGQR